MYNSILKINLALTFILLPLSIHSQEDGEYSVSLSFSGGYSYYNTDVNTFGLNVHSFAFSAKAIWEPEHLLSAGIETGFYPMSNLKRNSVFTRYGITDLNTSLTAYPIMIFFSMNIIDELRINSSLGGVILSSLMDSFGNKVRNNTWSNSFGLGASYAISLNDYLALQVETRWIRISKTKDDLLSIQVGVKYAIIRY